LGLCLVRTIAKRIGLVVTREGAHVPRLKRRGWKSHTPRATRGGLWATAHVLSLSFFCCFSFSVLLFKKFNKKFQIQTKFEIWKIENSNNI
jgi:hypothetical protein